MMGPKNVNVVKKVVLTKIVIKLEANVPVNPTSLADNVLVVSQISLDIPIVNNVTVHRRLSGMKKPVRYIIINALYHM